jgi:hypothetical protein
MSSEMFDFRNPERALPAYSMTLRARGRSPASPSEHVSRFHELDAELRDFLIKDDEGILGVVDEVHADATVLVACGWFGRRHMILCLEDIREIRLAERTLILRPGIPEVDEMRAASGSFARLLIRLAGRSLAVRSRAQSRRSS